MTTMPSPLIARRSLLARCFGPSRFYLLRLVALWVAATAVTLLAWLALTWWLNHEPHTVVAVSVVTSGEVFNTLLVSLAVLAGLPMWHAACYRWLWQRAPRLAEQPKLTGPLGSDESVGRIEAVAALPPAGVLLRSQAQRLTYLAVHALGMPLLLWVYAPLDHQRTLAIFIARRSAGKASLVSLSQGLLVWLPMGASLLVAFAVMHSERAALGAGRLSASEILRLRHKHAWLVAFAVVSVLCLFVGRTTLRFPG